MKRSGWVLLGVLVGCGQATQRPSAVTDDAVTAADEGVAAPGEDATEADPGESLPPEPDGAQSEPDVEAPPPGGTITGCSGASFVLPSGMADARVNPHDATLVVGATEAATLELTVLGITADGNAGKVHDVVYTADDPAEVGTLHSTGIFESHPGRGGKVVVRATSPDGWCIETTITVVTVHHEVAGDAPPQLADWFATAPEPAVDSSGPALAYPLDGAAWPANLPSPTVQWTYDYAGPDTVFRVGFEAPYARVYVYGTADHWALEEGDGWTALVPKAAWQQVHALTGGSPHQVSVAATVMVDGGISQATTQGPPATIHVTDDLFGGAVYYWNIAAQGIRVLEYENSAAFVDDIAIEGGCHGCHAVSPDGETIAVSFNQAPGSEPAAKKWWSMQLHDVDTGAESDWVHDDAAAFLGDGRIMYAAFSEAFWTNDERRVLVTRSDPTVVPETSRTLFSVDLLTGLVGELTADATPGSAQLFPSFSGDGSFVVFADSEQGKGGLAAQGAAQLYRMPYASGAGGAPEPLEGASAPDLLQYYPAITPDDAFVVFNRASSDTLDCPLVAGGKGGPGSGGTYDNCHADLWIVDSDGGAAVRLDAANGPEDGTWANSWPSMSAEVSGHHYWVAFSSRRPYGLLGTDGQPGLWITAVDPNLLATGADPSFAPVWLPGQDADGGNHIGQWSVR